MPLPRRRNWLADLFATDDRIWALSGVRRLVSVLRNGWGVQHIVLLGRVVDCIEHQLRLGFLEFIGFEQFILLVVVEQLQLERLDVEQLEQLLVERRVCEQLVRSTLR